MTELENAVRLFKALVSDRREGLWVYYTVAGEAMEQSENNLVVVEHYDYHDRLLHIIEGEDARSLCATILELGLVSQLDHAAYLGRELMRAELSIRYGLPFVQDSG